MEKANNNINFDIEISSFSERIKIIMVSVFLWGILAHGFMIFNKFSYHDDIAVFYGISKLEDGIAQGRWMCLVYGYILSKSYGFDLSLPLFKGMVSFLFIAISWIALSNLLELKNKLGLFTVSGILAVFSSITSLFGFIYMALYYTFGFVLSICGGAFISRGRDWRDKSIGIILLIFAIGTYQMFFVTGICTVVVYMIKKVVEQSYKSFSQYLLQGMRYIFQIGICLGIYVIVTKVLVAMTGIPLSNYKNIDKFGIVNIGEYIKRVAMSYGAFFSPNKYVRDVPYPNICITLYHIILFILIVISAVYLLKMLHEGKKAEFFELAILLLVFPLASNFIFVLSGPVGALQYYGHIFIYILLALMVENFHPEREAVRNIVNKSIFISLILLNIAFCRLSNACYLKLNLLQEHAISYFETLNARIQMTEGYTASTAVAFVEPRNKIRIDVMNSEMEQLRLIPYGDQSIVNNYQWVSFARIWCGFFPIVVSGEEFKNLSEVKAMPNYPDDGSIKMIDGVVVVKFNDTEE